MPDVAKPEEKHRISHYDTSPRELSFRMKLRLRMLAGSAVTLTRLLGPTLRYEMVGWQNISGVHKSGRRCIYAIWHCAIFMAMWGWRNRDLVAMTSANFDGQVLAHTLGKFGYSATYGSSSRGGLRGLAELARKAERGHDTVFAADGPRGPRYVAKAGFVQLARRTGYPIVCVHLRAERAHIFEKSWDQFQLPRPFSRVVAVIAPPIEVPREGDREIVDKKQTELQGTLERVRDVAESWFTLNKAEREKQRAFWNA